MNSSASLTASSVIFNTGSENFGVITAANVTFNDGSANSGVVEGDAQFNGFAINRATGTISGNAAFADTSVNSGTVVGDATFAATATNEGTVSGTETHTGGGPTEEQLYQTWLAANTGVNSYPGAGTHNGQWAYNATEYGSQADAQAAYDAANNSGGGGDNGGGGGSSDPFTRSLNGDGYADWSGSDQGCFGQYGQHGNLFSSSPTLAVGVGLFVFDGSSYVSAGGPWQIVVNGTRFGYDNGVITDVGSC